MPNKVREWLGQFVPSLLNNILSSVLIAMFGVSTIVSYATGTIDVLLETIKSPMPLWAATLLCSLVGLYESRSRKPRLSSEPPNVKLTSARSTYR